MINFERSREIFLKIYDSERLCGVIESYITANKSRVKFFLKFCNKNRWELCLKQEPMMKLALVYAFLPTVWDRYKEMDISEDIFFATMNDIKIWINDHKKRTNEDGLYELHWIMHHMNLNIFKLGRLQFQKFFYYFKTPYEKDGDKTDFGDKIINVHIPRGEKLDRVECEKSFEIAKEFFAKYFSEYPNNKFVCHSWLLYSGNKNFMAENSNILQFADLFINIKDNECAGPPYLWMFGVKMNNKTLMKMKKKTGSYGYTGCLPQKSSLQRNAIEYINNGGTLGEALGIKFI